MKNFILLFVSFWSIGLCAQGNFCGSEGYTNFNISEIELSNLKSSNSYNGNPHAVFFHIVEDESSELIPLAVATKYINDAFKILKKDFDKVGICLANVGYDFILVKDVVNGSGWGLPAKSEDLDKNNNGKFDVLELYCDSRRIDIFIVPNTVNQGGRAVLGGTSLIIGGTDHLSGKFYFNTSIISHELGHCFGLYHTFHGSKCEPLNCPEEVNGSIENRENCGDFISDTPADPGSFTDNNCNWNGTSGCTKEVERDANGDLYNPNLNLIMSYNAPSCVNQFTKGQEDRMKLHIVNNKLLEATLIENLVELKNDFHSNQVPVIRNRYSNNLIFIENVRYFTNSGVPGSRINAIAAQEIRIDPNSEFLLGTEVNLRIRNFCVATKQSIVDDSDALADFNDIVSLEFYETDAAQKTTLFPNPAKVNEAVYLDLEKLNNDLVSNNEATELKIIDNYGKIIFSLNNLSSYRLLNINSVINLPPGIYMVLYTRNNNVNFQGRLLITN